MAPKNQGGTATQPPPPAPAAPAAGTTEDVQNQEQDDVDQAPAAAPAQAPKTAAAAPAAEPQGKAIVWVAENHGNTSQAARNLLLEACELFGVNPDSEARPRELRAWAFYPGDPREDLPAAVTIVTEGGKKLKTFADPDYPMDRDTDEKLAEIFGAYTFDKDKNKTRTELPADLTLPRAAVTGLSEAEEHKFKGGYLRSGGRAESARREEKRTAARRK